MFFLEVNWILLAHKYPIILYSILYIYFLGLGSCTQYVVIPIFYIVNDILSPIMGDILKTFTWYQIGYPSRIFFKTLLRALCLRLYLFTMVYFDFALPYATLIHMITIKLTSANYHLWHNQVETLLTSQDLFGYMDANKPIP